MERMKRLSDDSGSCLMRDLCEQMRQTSVFRDCLMRDILKIMKRDIPIDCDDSFLSELFFSDRIREHFFIKKMLRGQSVYVFDRDRYFSFLKSVKMLLQPFFQFQRDIGLPVDDEEVSGDDVESVVLLWPYKDCVLEGGQDKVDQKKEEYFYNETVSCATIEGLLAQKVFTNFRRHDGGGEESVRAFSDWENCIIKGNNLLILHSLKEQCREKVKLIYADPPYNTGNDSFLYNDRFNHSTWLTFMKNRLEVAREFLREDGVIFISCDDNEQAYLKVLMDEVFGRDNFIGDLIRKTRSTTNDARVGFNIQHENTLIFSKNKTKVLFYIRDSLGDTDCSVGTLRTAKNAFMNQVATKEKNKLFEKVDFAYSKPESFLKWIIEVSTQRDDIVLDYHLGTGTTVAVAHKLGRRYIGIEQMDVIQNIAIDRLKKVFSGGDDSAISQEGCWTGGGSFVSFELKKWNDNYKFAIQESKTIREMTYLYKKIKEESFFRYEIKSDKEWRYLSLAERKSVLYECLENNHLYVNRSEMDRSVHAVDEEDRRLNKEFYGR